jgi:hypothetical protein
MVIAKSFTAAGNGTQASFKNGSTINYVVSGTFVGTVVLESSENAGQSWETIASKTAAASGSVLVSTQSSSGLIYRWRCSAFTSGTIVTSIYESSFNDYKKLVVPFAGLAKAGATSGFAVAPADDISLVTCPAAKTASTCVLPLVGLQPGQIIKGLYLVGQIESAGNTATVDANLRKHTAAAADVADASVGSIAQISVTADAIIGPANSAFEGLSEVVDIDETFYVLVTATTAASTDVALQSVVVLYQ